jgi:hypothetical protein
VAIPKRLIEGDLSSVAVAQELMKCPHDEEHTIPMINSAQQDLSKHLNGNLCQSLSHIEGCHSKSPVLVNA